LDRLQVDNDNLRAALAWSSETAEVADVLARLAGSLWLSWWTRGYFTEGRRWPDRALERTSEPRGRIEALLGACWLDFFQDDYVRAREVWEEILVLGPTCGDRLTVAWALGRLGFLARRIGDYERAVALCDESLALNRQLGDGDSLAHSLMCRGHVAIGQGDNERAESCWEECLSLAREIGHEEIRSHALHLLAGVVSLRGQLDTYLALARAYNAWLVEEWTSRHPALLAAVALVRHRALRPAPVRRTATNRAAAGSDRSPRTGRRV